VIRKPLGVEGGGVLLRVLVVAGRQIAAHEDLADLTRRQRSSRLAVDDADLHAGQRKADRGPALVGRVVRVGHAAVAVGLGEAVDVADLAHAEIHHHLHRRRRTDRGTGAERRQIAPRAFRMLGEGQRDIGRAVVNRAPLALDQRERRARLQRLLQHDRAAMGHHRQQRVRAAEAPEERDPHPHPIRRRQVLPLADVPHVLDEAAVRELDALRRRGRPRRIEDVRDVVGRDGALGGVELGVGDVGAEIPERVDCRRRAPAVTVGDDNASELRQAGRARPAQLGQHGQIILAGEARDRDQGRRVTMVEHVSELATARPGTDGDERGAEHGDGEVDHQPLRAVAHQKSNLVASPDAEPPEPLRELPGSRARLGVAQALAAPDDELVSRVAGSDLVEQVGQGAAPRVGHDSS
jgi:hypothetical protein